MNPKYVTSLETSMKLKISGVPQNSEFYWTPYMNGDVVRYRLSQDKVAYARWGATDEPIYSAFLTDELGEMLPDIVFEKYHPIFHGAMITRDYSGWVAQVEYGRWIHHECEVELRGLLVLYLIENKLISFEAKASESEGV